MSQQDTAHAWWSRLRHQGLLLSPVVMLERFPAAPEPAPFHKTARLRDAYTRFVSTTEARQGEAQLEQSAILAWTDALLENYVGHGKTRIASQHSIPENLTAAVRIGTRSDTIRPHRVVFADDERKVPALLVMADTSHIVGQGRGRTVYSRFLELLRGSGHRLGLLTNGRQFRLVYAGLDFESWCEWEGDRWFNDGDGTEELNGLRQLLSPDTLKPVREGMSGLLDAVEESRKRQADLSSVLRENVRQAVERLLEDVSTANKTNTDLFASLKAAGSERPLADAEAHEALLQATVRVVMRLVVCLFAESRQLLPVDFPIYAQAYGVRSLYELLEETIRNEGGTHGLMNRNMAWPRLMALFRLIYGGSGHGAFPMRAYGGLLFRPGDDKSSDAVARALHILEHAVSVSDATVYHVLRKLLRGPLPVLRGRAKTFVEGPVDYTDLRTEFIGLIYEGLLDYKLKRTDEKIGPQVFLNLGREPVLPLARLEEMLQSDKKGLKDLLTTLRKEKVTASAAAEEEEAEEEAEEQEEGEEETTEAEVQVEPVAGDDAVRGGDYLDAVESAKAWAKEAVVLAGIVAKQKAKEPDREYQARIDAEATKLIKKVIATGEFYLVRAGNTRKGTGTFYTRPQLAVPTVHRTLEPLCYDKAKDGTLVPKTPEVILGLKVCDPACGSASFLVAALHYLADALYKSLCHHRKLDDPDQAKKLTLPYGRPRNGKGDEDLVKFPPNDPHFGENFEGWVKARLRRHVVERCIYGVDINPLAVEFARVSLWVETLDPELPFSFLDHKIKVGNSLVGCWLDRVLDYPLKAWEREGGDGKDGPRTQRIEEFLKGEKVGNRRSGDGRIKREMREVIESRFQKLPSLFPDEHTTTDQVVAEARTEYERLHDLPITDPDERERYYREHVENSPSLQALKRAMDEWCAVWFWPSDDDSLKHVPTPLDFHKALEGRAAIIDRLASDVKFFHWELAFPDVFTPQREGFDAVVGNPPWEVMKPNSHEFFTDHDPIYRTFDKQAAVARQQVLFASMPGVKDRWDEYNAFFKALSNHVKSAADPFDLALLRGKRNEALAAAWSKARAKRVGYARAEMPFVYQGSADLNSYKLFLEVAHHLLTSKGRLGFIVPSGLYTDSGTQALRQLLLEKSTWEWLFSFENRKKIFDIDGRFKFAATIVDCRKTDSTLKAAFMVHDLEAWERSDPPVFEFDRTLVPLFSPKSKSLPEVRTQRDLAICRKIYEHSIRIGDNAPGWEIAYACEFHMTNDAKAGRFSPLEKWKAKGYKPDVFGRWIGPKGEVALPLYEGRMIGQFDFSQKGWVSGKRRTAVWREIGFANKAIEPQYLMSEETYAGWEDMAHGVKLAFMDITSATNTRTMIATAHKDFPFGNSAPVLSVVGPGRLAKVLLLASATNSLAFDFCTRQRSGGLHLNWFIISECPIPFSAADESKRPIHSRLIQNSARLSFVHRCFAPEWLRIKHLYPELARKEWKHPWAVTEADRLRLRVEIDALCADLYGLDPDDFDWIVRDDPTDPKGFWRVDKHLPYRERLTGLAASAFRALKEGKWSAESAARMTNDEFFQIIGIPEMTTGPEPLIRKRDGCHHWKPEEFGKDDPRHGWTWDHCWQDAVALLGSEEAVREYVEGKKEQTKEEAEHDGPTDLFGKPIPVKPK
jgi:methylase of polypeptide subunit release factors